MDDDESREVLELLQRKDREIHALTDAKARLEEKVDAMRWDLELAQGGLDYSAAFNTQLLAFEAQLQDLRTKTDLALQPRQIAPDTRQAMALEQRLQRGETTDSLLHQRLHSMFQANCELIQRFSRPSCREVAVQTTGHQRGRFVATDATCCDCATQLQQATDELRGLRAAALLSQLAAPGARKARSSHVHPATDDLSTISLRCDGATSRPTAEVEAELDRLRESVARYTSELQTRTEELQNVRADVIIAAKLHQHRENALRMTLADVEAQLVASRAQCEDAERAKLEIIHQATQLVQAAEAETGTALNSLDAFNQMQLRPWIDVAHGDRTAKYTLQTTLAAANDKIVELQADVALEMAAARELRVDAEVYATQAVEWSALSDAYEHVQAELQARVRSLSTALAQALSSRDASVDWAALVPQLLAQPSPAPQYPPKEVLGPDRAHVCSWQRQAATWRQTLHSRELALQALQDQLHQQAANSSALDASKAANSALRKKAATAKAEVETLKAAAETAKSKTTALQREKAELNHMVSRLREENAKLRDSAQRKSELVAFYKSAAEKAKHQHDAVPRPPPASNQAPTAAKTALIKHLQEQLAVRTKDAAATNDALQKAQAHNHVLSSRCGRLQMALRDKMSSQHRQDEDDDKDTGGDDATSGIQAQLRECKRRLQQKQSILDGFKAKDAAQKDMLATCTRQLDQLRAQLQSHSTDAANLAALLAQFDGLRASVYDAVHSAFAFRSKKGDYVDGVSVSDLRAVGCTALDETEITLLRSDNIQQQVLSGLELALEVSPEDCRRALLDALLELRHAGSAGKF